MNSFPARTQSAIEFAADLLRQSKHAVLLTGAGLSTPSGIPDFRSTGTGLWAKDEPLEVASLTTFRTAPQVFFNWFRPLASQIYNAQPNAAHFALARLERCGRIQSVITQNVDALHQKAGAQNVIELHGTMQTLTCSQCYHREDASLHLGAFVEEGRIPRCTRCGQVLKPDVILFGEQLPQAAWFKAQREARRCDLMLVVGSSLEVLPAAGLPMQALDRGAHLIIVNNAPTYINIRADAVLTEDAAAIIPAIAEKVFNG
ncbi:MAG: NAD-dependent deacylase [Chloroflexi bacterium]|nr:NAD-dependent deacylase [Chloroflexota bacterium]MCA2003076.1 NAD-dependent deacylase [Chloroflexota bacterium]